MHADRDGSILVIMDDESRYTGGLEGYPSHAPEGRPGPRGRRRAVTVGLWVTAVLVAGGLVAGAAVGILYAFNPVGDEWVCSDGETPAGVEGAYSQCFRDGSTLPAGFTWDPLGNRPMPYNCDKRGWVRIERAVATSAGADVERDCVRKGTTLPGGWRVARDD